MPEESCRLVLSQKTKSGFGEPGSPERSRDRSASPPSGSSIQNGLRPIKNLDAESCAHAAFIKESGTKSVGDV